MIQRNGNSWGGGGTNETLSAIGPIQTLQNLMLTIPQTQFIRPRKMCFTLSSKIYNIPGRGGCLDTLPPDVGVRLLKSPPQSSHVSGSRAGAMVHLVEQHASLGPQLPQAPVQLLAQVDGHRTGLDYVFVGLRHRAPQGHTSASRHNISKSYRKPRITTDNAGQELLQGERLGARLSRS